MDYYFDESGNWAKAGYEQKRLLIGGLLFKNEDLEKSLDQEFRIFQAEQHLSTLHATELSPQQKGLCYQIIDKHLTSDTQGLVHIFDPGILKSRTRIKPDEVYIECATNLIRILALGDLDIRVFYDMKFHYTYPVNIIRQIKKIPWHMRDNINRFTLDSSTAQANRDAVLDRIKKLLSSRRLGTHDRKTLDKFAKSLSPQAVIDVLSPDIATDLETEAETIRQHLADYFWSELWLKFEGREKMRENFRASILTNINQTVSALGMNHFSPSLKIQFLHKQKSRAGIIAIDFICNLVYNHGKEISDSTSTAERNILEKVLIQEIRT